MPRNFDEIYVLIFRCVGIGSHSVGIRWCGTRTSMLPCRCSSAWASGCARLQGPPTIDTMVSFFKAKQLYTGEFGFRWRGGAVATARVDVPTAPIRLACRVSASFMSFQSASAMKGEYLDIRTDQGAQHVCKVYVTCRRNEGSLFRWVHVKITMISRVPEDI